MTADGRVNIIGIEGLEVFDDGGGGLFFVEGELGVGVEPFVLKVG
jgi:hypothetical protein